MNRRRSLTLCYDAGDWDITGPVAAGAVALGHVAERRLLVRGSDKSESGTFVRRIDDCRPGRSTI